MAAQEEPLYTGCQTEKRGKGCNDMVQYFSVIMKGLRMIMMMLPLLLILMILKN